MEYQKAVFTEIPELVLQKAAVIQADIILNKIKDMPEQYQKKCIEEILAKLQKM